MQLDVIYPEHVYNIREIRVCLDVGDIVGQKLEEACQELEDNLFIATAQESGIARREKILGITPLDTESLEDRRLKVMLNWYDKPPYTIWTLRRRLDASLGEGNYVLTIDYENQMLECLIELTRKSMFKSVQNLFEELLPLDIIFNVQLRYNQYMKLKKFTYGRMKAYTYSGVKGDILP